MTRALYLDCEFNGNRGMFISIALFDPKENNNFYEVSSEWVDMMKFHEDYGGLKPWVKENVIPMLCKKSINSLQIQTNLQNYLNQFDDVIIYADWPEDFKHLMSFLWSKPSNTEIPIKLVQTLKMELITTPDTYVSKIPHNALEDAKALYMNHTGGKIDPTG